MEKEKPTTSKLLIPTLSFADTVPVYELTGEELVFPIVDGKMEFYVHMSPYGFQELKDLMAEVGLRMKPRAGGIIRMVPSDPAAMLPFFWKHFLRMSGVRKKDGSEPSVEEQIAFIKANPRKRIAETTVLQGFGGIRFPEPADEDEAGVMVIDAEVDEGVRTYVWLHDPEGGQSHRVHLTHRFRPAREADVRIYARATGQSEMNTRRQEMIRQENLDVLEIL